MVLRWSLSLDAKEEVAGAWGHLDPVVSKHLEIGSGTKELEATKRQRSATLGRREEAGSIGDLRRWAREVAAPSSWRPAASEGDGDAVGSAFSLAVPENTGVIRVTSLLPAVDQGTDVGCPWPIRQALQEPRALGLSRSYEPPTHSVIGTQLLLRNEDAVMFLPALILNL
uniref:Uncharacterized protein n=1 Tax=Oryza glumipatula TaxID=40148 RepID=A0A0E0BAC4_9ORYZ